MPQTDAMDIRSFVPADAPAVVALWAECDLTRPWNDPHRDIDRKVALRDDLFLVGVDAGEIVATVMAGYEGHRGWINYLAVADRCRRRGYGRDLMDEAQQRLVARGCPKINLQVRAANRRAMSFYESLGYRLDDVVSMGKRLVDDSSPSETAS